MSRNGQRNRPRPSQVKKVLARQQAKERAKVAQEIHKLQQLDAGDKNPHVQEVKQQLALVVKGHNELVEAYNRNWQGFGQSIQHLDSRVGAMSLVLDDIVRGGIENVTKLSPVDLGLHEAAEHPTVGGVHWPGYIKMYLKQVEAELALLKDKHASEAQQTEPFDPLITPEDDADESADYSDVTFGGKDGSSDGETSTGLEDRATG